SFFMKPADIQIGEEIRKKLLSFMAKRSLHGINSAVRLNCFIAQMIDSIRRIKYISVIRDKKLSPICADPNSIVFDPLKAAAWNKQEDNIDEACWLIFLSIHFGKNKRTKWNLVRDTYSGLNNQIFWNWENTSINPNEFRQWLNAHEALIRTTGSFGNHRKYQSLNAFQSNGTGVDITLKQVHPPRGIKVH
ncbi:MAG TPA: hypothetical protein VIJ57_15450, partial [Hanamia sp.]